MTCQLDEIDDSLRLQNQTTGAASLSIPPTLVVNTAPNGAINTPTGDVTIAAGDTVGFTATCSDADATTPFRFAWNFGGGAPNVFVKDPGPVQFTTPGTFTVTLTCADALGAADNSPDTRTVTVIGSGLRGRVTTGATGTPVPDLTIQAYHFDSGAFIAQTTTAATGIYLLALPAGRYRVVALGTEQLATLWSGNVADFDTALPVTISSVPSVDFALAAGGTITGIVTDPNGAPVAERSVDIFDVVREHFIATARTGLDGRFARGLAPGHYKVRVHGGNSGLATAYFDQAPVLSAARPVQVTLGSTTPDVNVQLVQGGRMLGRVINAATGLPVHNAQILVEDIPRGFVSPTRTEADGTYVISLAPGQYKVRVRAAGTDLAPQHYNVVGNLPILAASTPVTITAGADTANINFNLTVGGKITGRVVAAADGTPIAGVGINASEFASAGFVNGTSTRFDGT
jgi:hypothetical protein